MGQRRTETPLPAGFDPDVVDPDPGMAGPVQLVKEQG